MAWTTPDPRSGAGRAAPGWSTPPGAGGSEPYHDVRHGRPDDTAPARRENDTREYGAPAPAPGGSGHDSGAGTTSRRGGRSAAFLVTLAVLAGLLGGAAGAAVYGAVTDDEQSTATSSFDQEPPPGDGDGAADGSGVVDVAEQVRPSVVSLNVGPGGGSGVVISSDGMILTNNHVVQAARGGQIVVTFADRSTAPAEVVGADPLTDLAVIRAQDVSGLDPAELGSSTDLQVGAQVVAIGSPLGLQGTVTSGIVSALDRPVSAGDGTTEQPTTFNAIQTDAPINPGNSGGPLVNTSGQVIGINSAIYTTPGSQGSIGLGFAVPIDQARVIAEDLIDDGQATHAQLGVLVGNPQDERGAEVVEVQPGSAAADVGLQEGDIITEVDGEATDNRQSLVATVREYRPGDEVTLTVVRDGETTSIDVTLGESEPTS